MKKVLLALLLLILGVAGYVWYKFSTSSGGGFEGDKAVKLKVNKHSEAFNKNHIGRMLRNLLHSIWLRRRTVRRFSSMLSESR